MKPVALSWGAPKLKKQSQPLVGRSSPYCEDIWRTLLLNKFFFVLPIRALVAKILTNLCDGAQMAIFGDFFGPAFPPSRVQHISDLHSKFALGPHHVWTVEVW